LADLLARFWCEVPGYVELERDEADMEIGPPGVGFGRPPPTIVVSRIDKPKAGKNSAVFKRAHCRRSSRFSTAEHDERRRPVIAHALKGYIPRAVEIIVVRPRATFRRSADRIPAVPGHQTHDYVRHGTTSLFAALDVATGKVIGQHQRRHRHQEVLRFLKTIDANPPDLDPHLICDNDATHRTPAVLLASRTINSRRGTRRTTTVLHLGCNR
jgi:hypothetical protein